MNFEQFLNLSKKYDYIPVYEKITADLFTPVIAYLKLRKEESRVFFLRQWREKKVLAGIPSQVLIPYGQFRISRIVKPIVRSAESEETKELNIFDYLKDELHTRNHPALEELPSFTGGTAGYLAYENIALIEKLKFETNQEDICDSILGVC